MIDALLHGKLTSRQENMEDILTSNVFGMLQYVTPGRGLFRFLALARTPETHEKHSYPLQNLIGESYAVEYRFWPTWQEREPDVELRIKSSDADLYLIGIEAKYRSGKSSEAEADDVEQETREEILRECTDQLTFEWNELVHEAESWNSKPVLIYLTADFGCPIEQIRASLKEHKRKRPNLPAPTIYWLSWRELPDLFGKEPKGSILLAIASMAEKMELTYFRGLTKVAPIAARWKFDAPSQAICRKSKVVAQAWRFHVQAIRSQWAFHEATPEWCFCVPSIAFQWRFQESAAAWHFNVTPIPSRWSFKR